MSISLRARTLAAVGVWLLAGCGGSNSTTTNADPNPQVASDDGGADGDDGATATVDADAAPPVDHGAPSTTYPAFPPDQPELSSNGGPVLTAPSIVTVTWPGEPNADGYEKFGDELGGTEYWSTIVSEYGVGAATSGPSNHVRETTALASSVTDADLQALVAKRLGDATSGWPAPTDNSVYVLYLPTATTLMTQTGPSTTGAACDAGIGGYHESVTVNGKLVAVAILPQCDFGAGLSRYDETTLSASHEIAEASTDPQPNDNPAYFGVDDQHLAWMSFMQFSNTENGDLCEIYEESPLKLTSGGLDGYWVQRQWSNKSAKAGHNPCVPLPSEPYFNVAPLDLGSIKVTFAGQTITSKGLKIPAGQSKTVTVGFYSDAATQPWLIESIEGSIFTLGANGQPTTHDLQISIDKTSGQNGEKAVVTIQVLKAGTRNHELATIVSKNAAGTAHFLPIFIDSTP